MDYEKALERARAAYGTGAYDDATLEFIFPQIKESEDERIRKELIDHCIQGSKQRTIVSHKEDYKRWLSWLEKQKPIDNTIKGGDIVIDKYGRVFLVLANVSERNYKEEYSTYCESLLLGVDGCVYSNGTDLEGYKNANEEDRAKFLHDLKVTTRISDKPAEWSEEDEKNLELVIDCIYEFYPDPVMKYKLKDWLKSLRPRSSWKSSEQKVQKINKWSKKDKKILQSLHHVMNCADAQNIVKRDGLSVEDVCTFLFSIEPNWKPSEEQMNGLAHAINLDVYDAKRYGLDSLYNDLKKLGVKEEPEYYQHFDPDC